MNKKYVLLRGLQYGNRFFTLNTRTDHTKLANGEIAYEVIGYADTIKDAQMQLYGYSSTISEE